MRNKSFSESAEKGEQAGNQEWWETNPMTYDWEGQREAVEGSREWFGQIDREFWDISKSFAHPSFPACAPFSSLIDYGSLSGKKILEIGCGMGSHAALLAQAGGELTAVDLTNRAVSLTSKRFELFGIHNATVLKADAEKLPFAANSFDFVWSWGVIHHSANTKAIVDEIRRVLRPGGRASIMVYHRNSSRYWIHGIYHGLLKGRFLRHRSLYAVNMTFTDGHIARHYTRYEAAELFRDFSDITTQVMDGEIPAMFPGWNRLTRLCPMLMRRLNKQIGQRWGWFLCVNAVK